MSDKVSSDHDRLIDFLYTQKEAAKERAQAEGAVSELQKDWRTKSRAWQDKRQGRAAVALGWTKPPVASSVTSDAAKLRTTMPRMISVSPGVVAPELLLGGVGLHARFPATWDVSIYSTATLGSTFAGFTLPEILTVREMAERDIAERLGVDPGSLDVSSTCLAGSGNKIKQMLEYEGDYAIELVAEVTTQIALDQLLGAVPGAEIAWAGGIQHGTPVRFVASYSDGSSETVTLTLAADPSLLAEGGVAIVHIMLVYDDGAWRMTCTRSL